MDSQEKDFFTSSTDALQYRWQKCLAIEEGMSCSARKRLISNSVNSSWLQFYKRFRALNKQSI